MLSFFQRHDINMEQRDSNSPLKDGPYAVSLDNGQINYTNCVKALSRHLQHPWAHGGPIP